jgi:hypothetical protein
MRGAPYGLCMGSLGIRTRAWMYDGPPQTCLVTACTPLPPSRKSWNLAILHGLQWRSKIHLPQSDFFIESRILNSFYNCTTTFRVGLFCILRGGNWPISWGALIAIVLQLVSLVCTRRMSVHKAFSSHDDEGTGVVNVDAARMAMS